MKKIIAAIMSLWIVGGALHAVYSSAPECGVTAFAEGNEYEEITEGDLTYRVYADYACMITCDRSAVVKIIIPSEINGVPVKHIGDANSDTEVNMSDVVMVMQACLNPKKYGVNGTSEDRITADGEKVADVDGKEGLTPNDALVIQRFTLKIINSL